jgi:hypothetical protein
MRILVQMAPIIRSLANAARRSAAQLRACSPLNCYRRLPYASRPAARMRRVKRRGERKETVTDKDLYRAILSVLQSHFDSTELSRPASHAEFNDAAVVNNSGDANRAIQAHQIVEDAVNDWLSAKLTPERLEFVGMMRD